MITHFLNLIYIENGHFQCYSGIFLFPTIFRQKGKKFRFMKHVAYKIVESEQPTLKIYQEITFSKFSNVNAMTFSN